MTEVKVINVDETFVLVPTPTTPVETTESEDDDDNDEDLAGLLVGNGSNGQKMSENTADDRARTFDVSSENRSSKSNVSSTSASSSSAELAGRQFLPRNTELFVAPGEDVPDVFREELEQIETRAFETTITAAQLWNDLDDIKEKIKADLEIPVFAVGSTASFASVFTVGYVTYLVHGGRILMSVVAQLPAWQMIDPLPILAALDAETDDNHDDSLASVVDESNARSDARDESNPDPELDHAG